MRLKTQARRRQVQRDSGTTAVIKKEIHRAEQEQEGRRVGTALGFGRKELKAADLTPGVRQRVTFVQVTAVNDNPVAKGPAVK